MAKTTGQELGVFVDALVSVQQEASKYKRVPKRLKDEIYNYTNHIENELDKLKLKVCTYGDHFE